MYTIVPKPAKTQRKKQRNLFPEIWMKNKLVLFGDNVRFSVKQETDSAAREKGGERERWAGRQGTRPSERTMQSREGR